MELVNVLGDAFSFVPIMISSIYGLKGITKWPIMQSQMN